MVDDGDVSGQVYSTLAAAIAYVLGYTAVYGSWITPGSYKQNSIYMCKLVAVCTASEENSRGPRRAGTLIIGAVAEQSCQG